MADSLVPVPRDLAQPEPQHIVGHVLRPTDLAPAWRGPRIITAMVAEYNGNTREQAAADVWQDFARRYPGCIINVVHRDDPNWELPPELTR